MSYLLVLLGTIFAFYVGCEALKYEILKPIRAKGDEVGLIFTSGNGIKGEQFKKTAEAIQAASDLRIWVTLTGDYYLGQTGLHPVDEEVGGAINALKNAGMKSEDFVGVAHGIGGAALYSEVKDYPLKAIILMGFCLPLKTKPFEYTVPVLTLVAELDGVTRITRAAEEFGKLEREMRNMFFNLYEAPVVYLEGMNHAQFASRAMTTAIKNNDLKPNVTDEEARRMIGGAVDSFLEAMFGSKQPRVNSALKEIESDFARAGVKFRPFLEVKDLDRNWNNSKWTIMAQEHVAGEFADRIRVNNKVGRNPWFLTTRPSIRNAGGFAIVETKTLVHYGLKQGDSLMAVNIPREINMKLKTKDAIWTELIDYNEDGVQIPGPQSALKSAPSTCKSLNELALQLALSKSTPEARMRYETIGRPIIFEDDSEKRSDIFWSMSASELYEKKDGLHVKAIAFRTPVTNNRNPGMLYCKVMSPYRAMEWVNFQSLQSPAHLG